MRIYIDTRVWHRPFDGRGDARVVREADALIRLVEKCESKELELVSSEILLFEVFRGDWQDERAIIEEGLALSSAIVKLNDSVRQRAKDFEALGIAAIDSLHRASAESGRAAIFITCDDRLINRSRRCSDLKVQVLDPLTTLERIEQ